MQTNMKTTHLMICSLSQETAQRSIEATATTKHSENFVKKASFSSQGSNKMQNIPLLKAD